MLRCVAGWGLNTGLTWASFSIFAPTKVFSPDSRVVFLPFCQTIYFILSVHPWTQFQLRIFLTRHIADVGFLKFPQKIKTGEKKTKKMMAWLKPSGTWKWILALYSQSLSTFLWTPNFPEFFPPHNHVYSNCSIWHLLSWLINYASPKNDPGGWDFDPTLNSRSFEKEACFTPMQSILAEAGHPTTGTPLSTQLPSRTSVATGRKSKWCQVWKGLQKNPASC